MDLRYSDDALEDLRGIVDYGLAEGFGSAMVVVDEIDQRLRTLATQPDSGRKGRVPGTREWVLAPLPFIVIYRLQEDVVVLRVLHGAQQ